MFRSGELTGYDGTDFAILASDVEAVDGPKSEIEPRGYRLQTGTDGGADARVPVHPFEHGTSRTERRVVDVMVLPP